MAEPRDPFIKDVPVVDEQTKIAGMKAAAEAAKNFPKVNPETGATSDLFQGKYGVFEAILNDPIYGAELRYIKYVREVLKDEALANDLWQKSKWGQLDSDAQLRYVQKLEQSKVYEERLKSWLIKIKATLAGKGLSADDATLTKYYNDGIDDITIIDELTGKISANGAKGDTAGTLEALRKTASLNGFKLEEDFGNQLDGWLQRIARGESIEDFKRLIREEAAKGQNKYVTDLLRSGYDLDGIYGNYISLMAQAFNIDRRTIKLDDPLLKSVFTDQGGMKFNDFQTLLRSDARFKGTPGMGEEKDIRQSIIDRALALGITLQESDVADIANNALSMGIGASSSLVDGLIRAKFRYAPGTTLGGLAGSNLQALKQTAAANGLELDKNFSQSEIQTWLSKILQGESIETYKGLIRKAAKIGLPEKVGSLLDLGTDLETVYAPYKNTMASTLEISPETIKLNDPVLRQAIGAEKEMSIYEWERFLRKDPRWQYTNQARADVSNSALTVLRNFGFQG